MASNQIVSGLFRWIPLHVYTHRSFVPGLALLAHSRTGTHCTVAVYIVLMSCPQKTGKSTTLDGILEDQSTVCCQVLEACIEPEQWEHVTDSKSTHLFVFESE